jgi:2-amino-4-hydroxy-6-hydroxymethyldihydropteridine diphosphokinase
VTRALLGMGSNLGDRVSFLREAVASLEEVTAVSPVYETEPVGGPDSQGPYLNLVVALDTDRDAHGLLAECRRLEQAAGRVRDVRWGPRTLDVDVLWVDGEEVHDHELDVPHPRMRERRFVLAPLHDVAPDLVAEGELAAAAGQVWPIGALADLAPESAP